MRGAVGREHRVLQMATVDNEYCLTPTGFMKFLPGLTGVARIVVEYLQNLGVYPLMCGPHAVNNRFLCHGRDKADTVFNRICGIGCVTPVTAAASRDSRGALVGLSNGPSGALS